MLGVDYISAIWAQFTHLTMDMFTFFHCSWTSAWFGMKVRPDVHVRMWLTAVSDSHYKQCCNQ